MVGTIEASGHNGNKTDQIQQPIIPLCQKLVFRVGKTHIQGKHLDASLDLLWKAGASKNIRGEVACDFCDTVVIFQCQIWWMSFAGAALCHLGRGRAPDRFPIISKCVVSREPFTHFRRLQTRSVKKCGRGASNFMNLRTWGSRGHGPGNPPRDCQNSRPSGAGSAGAAFEGLRCKNEILIDAWPSGIMVFAKRF